MSLEVAYVGNRGGNVFAGDGPAININQATINGLSGRAAESAPAVTSTQFGWTQDVDYFCNCATNAYDSLQAKLTKRFSGGYSLKVNYTLQKAEQDSGEYFQTPLPPAAGFFDTALNRGPADWDRTHNLVVSLVAEVPIGRGRTLYDRRLTGHGPARRRLAVQHQHVHSERAAVQRHVSRRRSGSRYRPRTARSHRRSGRAGHAGSVVQRDADRLVRQRVRPAGRRHVRQPADETSCAGPATGASTLRCSSTSLRRQSRRSKCASRR